MDVFRKAKDAVSQKAHWLYLVAKYLVSEAVCAVRQFSPNKAKCILIEWAPDIGLICLSSIAAIFLLSDCVHNMLMKSMIMPTYLLVEGMDPTVAGRIKVISVLLIPFVGVFIQFIAVLGGGTWGDDGVWLWFSMEIANRATVLIILPLYFYYVTLLLNAPVAMPRPSHWSHISLPWKLAAIRLEGRLGAILTAPGVMRGLLAFVVFYSLIGATTAAVVMVVRLEFLEPKTVINALRIGSATSFIFCVPRLALHAPPFSLPHGSRISNLSTLALFLVVIPAAIATVHGLNAWELYPMDKSLRSLERFIPFLWGLVFGWKIVS